MPFHLILENNQSKADMLIAKFRLEKSDYCVSRSVIRAKQIVDTLCKEPFSFILYVDYELDPGCGFGTEFLDYMIAKYPSHIFSVVVTTMSREIAGRMLKQCSAALIPATQYC